jgi:phosphohistidine phosphatase
VQTLYLLRHAKSSWDDPALPDRERPLAKRGIRDARRIAEHAGEIGLAPTLVLCSPAARTRATLELVRPALDGPTVRYEDALYGAAGAALLERLRAVPEVVSSVLVVGHNPGLQDLALALAARGAGLKELGAKFPTGALATLAVPRWGGLAPGDAELVGYVVPRQLRG